MSDTSITLCVATWKRYDLLNTLIKSAEDSHIPPDRIVIIDNVGSYMTGSPHA